MPLTAHTHRNPRHLTARKWFRTTIFLAAMAACAGAARSGQEPGVSQAPANIERKKQIGDDSARLLKLATELKAEVDKTNKDTLSVGVIRKADEIEKLAHNAKDKMKLTAGGS